MLFLGYVVWPTRIRVRGQTVRRFRRRLRTQGRAGADTRRQSLAAWRGHVRLAGSYRTVPDRALDGPARAPRAAPDPVPRRGPA